jgi:hypothetical protein
MEKITVTPGMVRAIEGATRFNHGWEIGGHTNTLRAMAVRGLVRRHDAGGTLTGRGLAILGHLCRNGMRRTFTAAELDGIDIEWEQSATIADVMKGDLCAWDPEQDSVRVMAKMRHLGGQEAALDCLDRYTDAQVPGFIAEPNFPVRIGRLRDHV